MIPPNVINIQECAFGYCQNLSKIYFRGNAPFVEEYSVFYNSDSTIVYRMHGATGWPPVPEPWADCPTALWLPEAQDDDSIGVQAGKFGFNIDWAEGLTVVVEGATNLAHPEWVPLATNTLTSEAFDFRDPQWTNYPGRYYRIRSEP